MSTKSFYYIDFNRTPIICISLLRNPETVEEIDLFFIALQNVLKTTTSTKKYTIAMDTSAIDSMLSIRLGYSVIQQLNLISELSKDKVQEFAIFIPNEIVRQVFQWLIQIRKPPVPWTLLSTMEESNQWLEKWK
jgi:hypothetical protein